MREGVARFGRLLTLLLAALGAASSASAQAPLRPALLIVEQEQLLTGSMAGQTILDLENSERMDLQDEGRRLDGEFEAEEKRLTDLRASTDPVQFRILADAFDTKVIAARREQEDKALALSQAAEARRRIFFQQVAPILLQLMNETGASAVVDQRSVLIANQNLNITAEVIKRLDEAVKIPESPAPAEPQPIDNN